MQHKLFSNDSQQPRRTGKSRRNLGANSKIPHMHSTGFRGSPKKARIGRDEEGGLNWSSKEREQGRKLGKVFVSQNRLMERAEMECK